MKILYRQSIIIFDHIRATTFLISDGADPGNSDARYITRRLLRRVIRAGEKIGIQGNFVGELSEVCIGEATAYEDLISNKKKVAGTDTFYFYETYSFPLELTEESGYSMENKASYIEAEKSRTASVGKLKGGLADQSTETTALHSVAYLLLAGLSEVLGDHVHQKGSNITSEPLRFDFNHDEKITVEQIVQWGK